MENVILGYAVTALRSVYAYYSCVSFWHIFFRRKHSVGENTMKQTAVLCWAIGVLMLCRCPVAAQESYDVVVYGGTSAAITTAVQVKQMGKSVVIVSPDKHLGGLTSGGLGFTDSGNVGTIGGLSREFYHRVYKEYQKSETWRWQKMSEYGNQGQGTKAMLHDDQTMWIFEPHVAERVYDQWVAECKIPVVREAYLNRETGVKKDGTRIVAITTLDGKTYRGKMFIDATYEGDLLAAAVSVIMSDAKTIRCTAKTGTATSSAFFITGIISKNRSTRTKRRVIRQAVCSNTLTTVPKASTAKVTTASRPIASVCV